MKSGFAYVAAISSCALYCLNGELLQALQRAAPGHHASPLLNLALCHLGGLLFVPHFGCASTSEEPAGQCSAAFAGVRAALSQRPRLAALPFALLLMGYNYAWLLSASFIDLRLTNAVFQVSTALVYIASVQLFGEAVCLERLLGVLLSLGGSFIASGLKWDDASSTGPRHQHQVVGFALALTAAVGYTAYQVLFRWIFGHLKQNVSFLAHFFSWISLWHLLIILPLVLAAHAAGIEQLQVPHGLFALAGTAVSALIASTVNVLYLCIVMWGSPMLLPSTSALSVPLTVVLDIVIHNERPEHREMVGQGLVLLSVVLIMQLYKTETIEANTVMSRTKTEPSSHDETAFGTSLAQCFLSESGTEAGKAEPKQRRKGRKFHRQGTTAGVYTEKDLKLKGDGVVAAVAYSGCFLNVALVAIVLNALWMLIDTEWNHVNLRGSDGRRPLQDVSGVVENLFCSFFSIEILIRFFGFKRWRFMFEDSWFLFDALLVILMVLETWILPLLSEFDSRLNSDALDNVKLIRLFRMLRLGRIFRILRFHPEMRLLVKSIARAMNAVFNILFLLVLVTYLFAIIFTSQLAKPGTKTVNVDLDEAEAKQLFANMVSSMLSLFTHGVLADELAFAFLVIKEDSVPLFWLFAVFVVFSGITLLNMLIGVLCQVVADNSREHEKNQILVDLKSSLEDAFELTVRLGNLRISITAEPSGAEPPRSPSPSDSFVLVENLETGAQASSETGPLAGGARPVPQTSEPTRSSDEAFIEARTLQQLSELSLGGYTTLARRLGVVGPWSPEARIARAFRAGVSAGLVLRGERAYQESSLTLGTRNRVYIVLRCPSRPEGFYCENFGTFREHCPQSRFGRLDSGIICHGFPSRAEAEAFVFGSGSPWPQETPTLRITAFVLKHRAGGFMVALPGLPEVTELLTNLALGSPEAPLLFTEATVACETPRRRAVGDVGLVLADVPWHWLGFFRRGASLRNSELRLLSITSAGAVVRPVLGPALAAADSWVASAQDEPDMQDSMGEYATAAEDGEDLGPEDEGLDTPDMEIARLRAQTVVARGAGQLEHKPGEGLETFFRKPGRQAGDWDRLRTAAGAPPPRIAQHERAPRPAGTQEANDLLAELDANAVQEDALGGGTADPILHKLLLIQTQMLSQLAANRPQGPLESALASGAGKDEGSLSAKGSAARDAYVRLLRDHVQVADQLRRLAAQELGESAEDPPASLMRTYIERRSPVGELRTLALVGIFAGHAWEQARRSENIEMEGWFARLLLFVDQAATEGGRTQLAWLLAGLPEPSWSTMVRKKQGVKPFSRMCPSLWASANIAYLKEMDWIAGRMSTTSTADLNKDTAPTDDPGCPCRPPARACVRGADLTDCQSGVIDTLERHCLHFLRAGRFCASQLGRSSEKFSALLNTVLELPSGDVDRVLSEITSSLHAELDPYTRTPPRHRLRDTIIFEGADRAYPAVGLVQHPKKRQRNVTKGTFLGADVDGVVGLISAPRHRVGVLMRITLLVVQRACASSGLLSSLLGLWVHVLLFRRPALAVLQSVFEDARRTPRTAVYRLQRSSLNELLALCALAPLLQADLRVDHPGMLFAMDASPSGAGLCAAELPPAVLKELWRHGEQKGFYTKLLEPAGALLAELDLHDDPGGFFAESVGDATVSGFAFGTEPLPLRPALAAPGCFVHLFARDPSWASAHCDLGLVPCSSPGLDLASLRLEDLASPTVFHQLRALLTSGAVFDLHVSAPVLSFASRGPFASRTPRSPSASHLCRGSLRSHDRLARRLCFLLCLAVSSGVFASVTQPASSMLFRLHCFRGLISLGAMLTKVFCCAFGAPFKKPFLVLHNKPWLLPLNSSSNACGCPPGTVHFPVGGTFSQSSVEAFDRACCPSSSAVFGCTPRPGQSVSEFCAAYPRSFSYRAAAGSALAASGFVAPVPVSASSKALSQLGFSGLGPDPPRVEASEFEPRLFHDDPEWIGEVADCLDFREILRYKFRQAGHINILESRAYKTWIKWCSKRFPRSRLLGLIDSRVLLGAAAKGRSASPALCRVLRSTLPYVLGSGLYPCGLHVYSAKNGADGPSRGPLTSSALQRLCLVCWAGPFYTGGPRGCLDLQSGFAPSTRHKMTKALGAFTVWLEKDFGLSLEAAMSSPQSAALALRAFGLHLYSAGFPRYLLVYAITSIQDRFPEFRTHLAPAWQIDRKWQLAEPGECRPVISQPILQACIALAICWGWYDWAALTAVGFLCMLHPAEMIPLIRQDLVFPADALSPDPVAYVHLRNPKTQRFARRQHARLEDPLVLQWLSALYFDLPLSARLFRGSMYVYRRQWNSILARLGIPHQLANRGATPGVLRGSGATFLYLETEDLSLVSWRGRWSKTKTVEFYLQEVAAQLMLHRLPPWSRDRIRLLASYARPLILQLIASCGDAK
ncbi:Sodium channel protein type 10 subunit alpha [Symbiodinium microadriaticum]|uniref:Sodium channel protein type 10 subunit alpha n=1 Tax=Symbiodinium microadriaticum TaxID=2951 RepID=A0A1Q9D187_SYMMI|nr:Sodium channel protein type 10 subunit alpha [Symbiodinium microadriaticum]